MLLSPLSLSLSLSLPLSRLPYSLCLEAFYLVHPAKDAERRNQGWDTSCGPSSILLVRSVLRVSRPCSRRQSLTDAKLQSLCSPNCKDPKPPKPESLAEETSNTSSPQANQTTQQQACVLDFRRVARSFLAASRDSQIPNWRGFWQSIGFHGKLLKQGLCLPAG